MKTYDNNGKLVSEINTIYRPDGGLVVTNSLYNGDRVVSQNISIRDGQGKTESINVLNGKLLP